MEHSTGYILFMYDAKFVNSGAYTCEVIVDTTFDTLMFTNKMLVIGKFAKKKGLFLNHMLHCGKKKGVVLHYVNLGVCLLGRYKSLVGRSIPSFYQHVIKNVKGTFTKVCLYLMQFTPKI